MSPAVWMVLELEPAVAVPQLTYEIRQAGGGLLERPALSYGKVNGRKAIEPYPALRPARIEPKLGQ